MLKNIKANAICLTCGTTKEDNITAFCINNHDNWLEENDNISLFSEATKKFGRSLLEIKRAIKTDTDLNPLP